MTTFIKAKLKKSENQTNKYRLAANITEYHIISKSILLRIINNHAKIHDVFKAVKNHHIKNGRTYVLVTITELLC